MKFSGFTAWWLWRTVYLAKLPGLPKKLRVMVGWTLDLFFGREIEQMITLRDVENVNDRLARLRNKATTDSTARLLDLANNTSSLRGSVTTDGAAGDGQRQPRG